jgi:hypothetical protein
MSVGIDAAGKGHLSISGDGIGSVFRSVFIP